jgi:hypothetical protein
MKYFLMIAALLLGGCSVFKSAPVPVARSFPAVPAELKQHCNDLIMTPVDAKMSDVLGIVARNYGQYHECRIRTDAWIEWYDSQRKIFEEVK